ncbi:MAG TPA: cupin domain-containing protein [Kofleriaceae bacterium]
MPAIRSSILALVVALALALAFVLGAPGSASAQAPGFKRTELARHDLAAAGREAVIARGEFAAGAAPPRHTHPGDELGYVLAGELTVEIDGAPPVKLVAGDTFFVPAGAIHTARNTGKLPAVAISTYIVEKGKPLATPVK